MRILNNSLTRMKYSTTFIIRVPEYIKKKTQILEEVHNYLVCGFGTLCYTYIFNLVSSGNSSVVAIPFIGDNLHSSIFDASVRLNGVLQDGKHTSGNLDWIIEVPLSKFNPLTLFLQFSIGLVMSSKDEDKSQIQLSSTSHTPVNLSSSS